MHPYAFSALLGISLALWVLLLRVEAHSGTRRFLRVRSALDRAVTALTARMSARMPQLNRHYFRQNFHYCVHVTLSALLWFVTRAEKGIKRIVRLNRSRARIVREPKTDSHLGKVLAHKETMALSEDEKTARKDAALYGRTED